MPTPFFHSIHRQGLRFLSLALTVFVLLATAACSHAQPPVSAPATPVTMQLFWSHGFEFTPFYAAEHHGHFKAQGLAVTLKPGGYQNGALVDTVADVTNGLADFGMTDAYNVLLARAQGKPLVAVATLFQRSPAAIISLRGSGIHRPQDLIGKRLALTTGSPWTYEAMLGAQGITLDQIQVVPRTSTSVEPLLKGEVDAMSGWFIGEGIDIIEAGQEPRFMMVGDYGTDSYQHVIFCTERFLTEHPGTVQYFVSALVRGIQDTLDSPDKTAELILQYDPTLNLAGQRRRLQASLPLLKPAASQPGMMQAQVWEDTHQVLLKRGILKDPVDVASAFTLRFLPK